MRKTKKRVLLAVTITSLSLCAFLPFVSSQSHAAKDWGGYMWKIEGKRIYLGETAGTWKLGIKARADGSPGDTINMGTSKSVSNSINTTCGISKKQLIMK